MGLIRIRSGICGMKLAETDPFLIEEGFDALVRVGADRPGVYHLDH